MALFGATKPDHPMADPKQARELLAELPVGDSAKALDEVTFWRSEEHTSELQSH